MRDNGKGTYVGNKNLDHNLGGPDYARAATVNIRLFTTMPNRDNLGGVEIDPAAFASYPLALTNNGANFPASVDMVKRNGTDWNFGNGLMNIAGVVGLTIDDGVGLMYYGKLATARNISIGLPFIITTGNATIRERLSDD